MVAGNIPAGSIFHSGAPTAEERAGGRWYVDVVDETAGNFRVLLGPFRDYETALSWVTLTRQEAERGDLRAFFYAFGVCRLGPADVRPGILNEAMSAKYPQLKELLGAAGDHAANPAESVV